MALGYALNGKLNHLVGSGKMSVEQTIIDLAEKVSGRPVTLSTQALKVFDFSNFFEFDLEVMRNYPQTRSVLRSGMTFQEYANELTKEMGE